MPELLRRLARDETGATAIEYAMLAGLVVLVAMGAMTVFGTSAGALMAHVADAIAAASVPPH